MATAPDAGSWFAVPPPVGALFKRFPLRVYGPEPLPARAPSRPRPRPRLFVFARSDPGHDPGRPSYNPSCLQSQVFLRIAGVDVDVVPSSNHASPSGSLPFLLPAAADPRPDAPLTGSAIARYAQDRCARDLRIGPEPRREAYLALLAQAVRPAWLYALYVAPANSPLLCALYAPPSALLRRPLLRSLRAAAVAEILRATRRPLLSPPQLLADADAAFRSLDALLADDTWFFGAASPGLLDAHVFAYTYLILDPAMGWRDDVLTTSLAGFPNLVRHAAALYDLCWGAAAEG